MTPSKEREYDKARPVRIGIDVGGTFTHAVAIDAQSLEVLGKCKVPTTHTADEGVALGIITALNELLTEKNIDAKDVAFIAHSTTQATNALIEGDVAPVGILGMGGGPNGFVARHATNIGKIELAPGKFLKTFHRFIDTAKDPSDDKIERALDELLSMGARAIAISGAFSVDQPEMEHRALAIARGRGLLATAGSEVSQLYGLKVRTRTAVINASMLPRMLESADMTEKSVREAGIKAPLMIMRSDGGVMDIEAMRRRPILTMLSGPAAGVAAAMMFLHISDGIFLEVGGTTTDISAITNGKAKIKSGEIGGHRVYTRTLDVRTVGVAGGSIPRIKGGGLSEVGPRSAHIAGLKYVSFTESMSEAKVELTRPLPEDPPDYASIAGEKGRPQYVLTPTCAANFLGLVPEDDPASGNKESIGTAMAALGNYLGSDDKACASRVLELATDKVVPIVRALIHDHKLDASLVSLVGGGGGAAAIVPYLSSRMKMPHHLAHHADVISAIGVALALIRESVERQIINPTNDDILRIREEAKAAVIKMGADPPSVEIHVEIDTRANIVRATAFGATSVTDPSRLKEDLTHDEKLALSSESMRADRAAVKEEAATEYFTVFGARSRSSRFMGLLNFEVHSLRVLDRPGNIRLQVKNGDAIAATPGEVMAAISKLVDEHSQWGDAGKVIPGIFLLVGAKIVDLSGLLDADQVKALAAPEIDKLPGDTKIIVIANAA